jgi:hypothetical protein
MAAKVQGLRKYGSRSADIWQQRGTEYCIWGRDVLGAKIYLFLLTPRKPMNSDGLQKSGVFALALLPPTFV